MDPKHLLRLGSGEKDLNGLEDFSRIGRVNWSLECRLQLLGSVQRLGTALGVVGDVGSSCEVADYFYQEHVLPKIEIFEKNDANAKGAYEPSTFPFTSFFPNVHTKDAADVCIQQIKTLFSELSGYRAFELLRTNGNRADYILMKQAR